MIDFFKNQFTASLWGDEGFAAVLSQKNLLDIVKIVSKDTSPPLYYFCCHAWMRLFGTSEIAIRALSFSFFIGTVLTIFLLAKYLWGKKTALIAALLTATNPFLFSYAFEGRMYAILAFTTTLSFYFFITENWILYVLSATAALYSHHFSIFAIFLQFLWVFKEFVKKPKKRLNRFLPYFFIFILYLPWLYPLYYQSSLVQSGFWLAKPTLKSINELWQSFLALGQSADCKKIVSYLALIILALRRWPFFGKSTKNKESLISLWLTLPVILTFIISHIKSSIFYDRYLLYVIPGLILLLASQRRKISLVFIAFLICLWGYFDIRYFFQPTKKPFRQMAEYIKLNTPSQTPFLIINYNGKAHHLWEAKYYDIPAPIYSPGGPLPFYVGTALMDESDVIYSLAENLERIGIITSDQPNDVKIENFQTSSVKKIDGLYFLWMERQI